MRRATAYLLAITSIATILAFSAIAQAGVVQIAQFTGTLQESWEQPTFPYAGWTGGWYQYLDHTVLTIMGGAATITNVQLAIWTYGNSTANTSGLSVPVDGTQAMGENTTGQITLTFANPVYRFGGYFQAYTNDYVNPVPIVFTFYDASNNVVGTSTINYLHANGDGLMDWAGWLFDTPVSRITWTETGGANDFLQADPVPEPSLLVLLAIGFGAVNLIAWHRKS
jgi:hypothetical protein